MKTILTLTILLSTLMAVGQNKSDTAMFVYNPHHGWNKMHKIIEKDTVRLTKHKIEDSIDKYIQLAHYYYRFDKDQTKWQNAIDQFEAFTKQYHAQQDSLYAIEQRKVLNKKYPEVGLK